MNRCSPGKRLRIKRLNNDFTFSSHVLLVKTPNEHDGIYSVLTF